LSAEEVVDRLKQMPTERLEKVEVLLSAPASYHVRGQVINIVTKDHYGLKQISGQLQGVGVFSKRSYVAGIGTLLYSNGRFSLDAMYSHPNGEKYDKTEYDAVQPLLTGPVSYSSTLENYMRILQHSFRAGMEYAFAPNNRLELAYTGRWLCPRTNSYAAGDEDTEQHSKKHNYLNNIDLGYTAPFGLQLGLSFTNYTYEEEQDLKGTIIGEEKGYRVDNHQKIRKWDFTADQSHSFNRGWGLSYGTRMQITQHDSWQKTYLPTGEPVKDETSEVSYTECIGSFYASLSKSWGDKVSADLGFQVENYNTPNWDNWRVYPTLNVLWQANANHTLNLSLSSNSTYPSYWSLMNSVFHSSAYMELWGNPELNPESNFDVTLSWQFHKNYSITAYYTIIDKSMMQLPYQPSD
ncbi:MAG: TonB-dependent receptor, partial [Bacteroidaceae bacterium]|nr:TonB-dependent receptor [Bacteroidaceae bacterium]